MLSSSDTNKAKEAQIGERGRLDIITIFNSEKRYNLDNGAYLIAANVAAINSGLGLNIRKVDFQYRVVATQNDFTVIATRIGGSLCNGKEIRLSADGGEVHKSCTVW